MKSFLILLSEKQPELLGMNLLAAHINYLKQLRTAGHLPLCGPFTDNKGAILVIRATSTNHAEKIISEDPFIKEMYYKKYTVQEFIEAGEENNWLSVSDQTINNLAA